jgi:type I restriction enzyme S subunit
MNKEKIYNKLVPELRFPEFEKGITNSVYKKYLFTDIFTFSTGKNIKQQEAHPDFKIPCVRYGELYHMYNEVIYKITNRTNLDKSELRFSKGNEILLPSAGEDPLDIGSASALTLRNIAIGRTINILRPLKKDVYSPIYVSYYINEKLRRKISTLAKGSTISNVYNSDLKKLEILLPSLLEQQKVANCLTSLDKNINLESEKLDSLIDHKKGLVQQLFPTERETKPQYRFKEFENDENWKSISLGDLISKNSLKNKELKYTLVQSVSNKYGFVNQNEYFENRRIASKNTSNYYIIKKGYFAYNPSRINIGSLAYKFDDEISIISPLYISFKAKKEFLVDDFLLNWFSTEEFIIQMKDSIKGGVRDTLSYNSLIEIKISVPLSIQEQQKIASCLSSADDLIQEQISKIEALKDHKKGLMQQLFPNVNNVAL